MRRKWFLRGGLLTLSSTLISSSCVVLNTLNPDGTSNHTSPGSREGDFKPGGGSNQGGSNNSERTDSESSSKAYLASATETGELFSDWFKDYVDKKMADEAKAMEDKEAAKVDAKIHEDEHRITSAELTGELFSYWIKEYWYNYYKSRIYRDSVSGFDIDLHPSSKQIDEENMRLNKIVAKMLAKVNESNKDSLRYLIDELKKAQAEAIKEQKEAEIEFNNKEKSYEKELQDKIAKYKKYEEDQRKKIAEEKSSNDDNIKFWTVNGKVESMKNERKLALEEITDLNELLEDAKELEKETKSKLEIFDKKMAESEELKRKADRVDYEKFFFVHNEQAITTKYLNQITQVESVYVPVIDKLSAQLRSISSEFLVMSGYFNKILYNEKEKSLFVYNNEEKSSFSIFNDLKGVLYAKELLAKSEKVAKELRDELEAELKEKRAKIWAAEKAALNEHKEIVKSYDDKHMKLLKEKEEVDKWLSDHNDELKKINTLVSLYKKNIRDIESNIGTVNNHINNLTSKIDSYRPEFAKSYIENNKELDELIKRIEKETINFIDQAYKNYERQMNKLDKESYELEINTDKKVARYQEIINKLEEAIKAIDKK
ncbi:Hypothetical protein, predicted lipoprotein, Spma family [Mycoplasmopsis agalactiae 14628]|uniref:Lipoprotein n=1 Tax=Mycoplasmopsis agalactiae 14628 TaxID=1110504 RepID=I5D634_MYCAA|nr:hypothetical protein [Mycoplasmopsis agalactiae]EIN15143.1 Hypothetical protein, predicted lipoprotein, Spma family [Mycoplasmopsis agalactiae 14628]